MIDEEVVGADTQVRQVLKRLIQVSPDWMALVDANLRYLDFNAGYAQQIERVCGSQPRRGEAAPLHVPEFHEALERARGGTPFILTDTRGLEWRCAPMGRMLMLTVRDVSDLARLNEDVAQLAFHVAHVDRLNQETFEKAAIGLANVSLSGRFLRVNRAFCEITGRSEQELLRLTAQDITHPDDLSEDASQIDRLLAGDSASYSVEKRYIRPDGSTIWVTLSRSLVMENGFPAYFIASVKDVTDNVIARRRSEAAHTRLRAALKGAHAALWGWSPVNGKVEWSPEFCELFGMPDEGPHSYERWLSCLVPEDHVEKERLTAEALANPGTDRISMEFRFHHPKRGLRWAMCLASILRDSSGRAVWMEGIAFDLTELRRAELRLRETEKRFNLAMRRGQTAAFALDLDLRYTWLHSSQMGVDPDWAIGKTDYDVFDAESAARLEDIYRLVINSEVGIRRDVTVVSRSKGVVQHFDLIVEPSFDLVGRVNGVLCVAFEITDRMNNLRALEEARAEAERANLAKTRFLAAASHDLRQPVQGMRLLLHLLSGKVTEPAQIMICARMGETLSSTEQMLSRLMEFAALEAGRVSVHFERVSLDALMERVIQGATVEAAEKGLSLRLRNLKVQVETDPVLLERIVRNFLSNAIRYTERGGVLVAIRLRRGRPCIEVRDTGLGIPHDKREVIFEEFHQLGNPERDRSKGVGLGLAIATRTAELLGCHLYMASTPGRGSMFGIELQEADRADECSSESPLPNGAGSSRGRILVIEDDPVQAVALQMLLEDSGYTVEVVVNGEQALEWLKEAVRPPDLILSDYRLPGAYSGLQLIAVLRERIGSFVPAILITGDTFAGIAEQAATQGCAVLHKPYLPNVLLGMLNMVQGEGRRT